MNSKQKSLIFGALIGAAIGALGGLLFSRGLEMPREDKPEERSVPPADIAKLGLSIMGVLRSVADLGARV